MPPKFTVPQIPPHKVFSQVAEILKDDKKLLLLIQRVGLEEVLAIVRKVRFLGNVMDVQWEEEVINGEGT